MAEKVKKMKSDNGRKGQKGPKMKSLNVKKGQKIKT